MTGGRVPRRRWAWIALAVAAAIAVAVVTAILADGGSDGQPDRPPEQHGHLAIAMGVSLGWGADPVGDVLHLADSGWKNYVAGYLRRMHVSWAHINLPWCELEPKAGVYDRSVFREFKSRVDKVASSGDRAFVTVIMDAPVFLRRDAMQRDQDGKPLPPSFTGCRHPPVYPAGEAAPKRTKFSLRNYAKTMGKLKECLRGTFCQGPDNRSKVMIESGAEANWHAGWQTGICARNSDYSDVPWYDSPGKDCGQPGRLDMGGGEISHIEPSDARFFGDLSNWAARKLNGSLASGQDTILGSPLFRRNGVGWGTGSVSGDAYLHQEVRGGNAGDHWARPLGKRYWDAAGLHVTVCDSGVTVQWSGCPGSMGQHVDEVRSTLRDAHINAPVWITGAVPCSEGDKQRVKGQTVFTCTAKAQAEEVSSVIRKLRFHACADRFAPVTHINWFRVVDPDNGKQFSGIGFMRNRKNAPYIPPYLKKPVFKTMAATSNFSCVRR